MSKASEIKSADALKPPLGKEGEREKHLSQRSFDPFSFKRLLFQKRQVNRPVIKSQKLTLKPKDSLKQPLCGSDVHELPVVIPQSLSLNLQLPIEKLIEQHIGSIAQVAASKTEEEINRLIKKLTLSFTARKNESQFIIKNGLFRGTKFHLMTDEENLSLNVINASHQAKTLLRDYEGTLKNRLADHEITLSDLSFVS